MSLLVNNCERASFCVLLLTFSSSLVVFASHLLHAPPIITPTKHPTNTCLASSFAVAMIMKLKGWTAWFLSFDWVVLLQYSSRSIISWSWRSLLRVRVRVGSFGNLTRTRLDWVDGRFLYCYCLRPPLKGWTTIHVNIEHKIESIPQL